MPRPISALAASVFGVLLPALAGVGCSRGSAADTTAATALRQSPGKDPAAAGSQANCGHAACGKDYWVDAAVPTACSARASCTLALTLVATGAYHINEEYPYRFRADDGADLQFLGKGDVSGNVFSKAANDWTKNDEKTGTMRVAFRAAAAGTNVISGVFNLSVCSAQNCQLVHQAVQASVTVR